METGLMTWVSRRLEADQTLSDDAKLLILAALEGRDALADMAGYVPPTTGDEESEGGEPAGAFLKQIKVCGFRGIGAQAQLDLDPYPSLTVISGRNGSGKSSFAEALEVALTGTTYRWLARASQWKEQWRNLHEGQPARIDVTLAEEDVGPTRITVEWAPNAELNDMRVSLQRHGAKKQEGIDTLGWAGPLETYRPMLTYEELGALLASEPKVLYDAISTVLGLEQVSQAVKALDEHRKALAAPESGLKRRKTTLVMSLRTLDDERAAESLRLLSARRLDLARLRELATGTSDETPSSPVRSLLQLALPDEEACVLAAAALSAAAQHVVQVGAQAGDASIARTELAAAAIAVHEDEGDQLCPVCQEGQLDADAVVRLREGRDQELQLLEALNAAGGQYNQALTRARSVISGPPEGVLDGLPEQLRGPAQALLVEWEAWGEAPDDPLELAAHLKSAGPMRDALAGLKAQASQYLADLDQAWAQIATELASYVSDMDSFLAKADAIAAAKSAHKWLKDNEIVLKNERVQPIAEAARDIWRDLRQESNVELAGLTLESSNTRRHVVISAAVDGEDVGALAVMSQGELHALALSLFLPRATMPDSPFRFVVLDDPVQAMDPAKVDGLVKVLMQIARTRQVVVFSHDDRFASAVRRAPKDVPVKVLEVDREANSKVSTRVAYSPADRYLKDAFALTKDSGLPDETLRRVLPGLLRMALEAEARELYFARELAAGTAHHQVEAAWEEARKTKARLALALGETTNIDDWLHKATYRQWALSKANMLHQQMAHGEPIEACRDVERTISDLKAGAR